MKWNSPQTLNLIFSGCFLAVSLAIYWIWHPARFHQHRFVERAFEFWILKWMLFSVTYGLLTVDTDIRFVLATVDLNTIMGVGFTIALWKGDSYDERHTIMNLLFLFGLLFSWNFISYPLTSARVWTMPSMTVAFLALFAMGGALFARHGAIAITFLAVSAAYVILQAPGYQVLFVSKTKDPQLLTWLAFGKVVYGATFYPVFFTASTAFEPIQLPELPGLGQRTSKVVKWALGAIAAGLLSEGALWVGKLLVRKITGRWI